MIKLVQFYGLPTFDGHKMNKHLDTKMQIQFRQCCVHANCQRLVFDRESLKKPKNVLNLTVMHFLVPFFWKDLNYHHFSLLLQSQRVYFFWIHEYQTRFYYSIVSTLDILPCQFQLQKGGRLKYVLLFCRWHNFILYVID